MIRIIYELRSDGYKNGGIKENAITGLDKLFSIELSGYEEKPLESNWEEIKQNLAPDKTHEQS